MILNKKKFYTFVIELIINKIQANGSRQIKSDCKT